MRALVVVAVLVAFGLRLEGLARFPPGLYRDEAYNGLDALRILAGEHPAYLDANNGREPLFAYLVAGSVGVLGRTPVAVRLPAVFVGAATVAALYVMGALLWGRRYGLVAAALFAVAPWPVLLGRMGFRAGTLPLVMTVAAAATWRAFSGPRQNATGPPNGTGGAGPHRARKPAENLPWHSVPAGRGPGVVASAGMCPLGTPPASLLAMPGSAGPSVRKGLSGRASTGERQAPIGWAALGGGLAGLVLYTYTAARGAPLLVLVVVGWHVARRAVRVRRGAAGAANRDGEAGSSGGTGTAGAPVALAMGIWLAAALVVATPLAVAAVDRPEVVLGRPGQVSILNPDINDGDALGALTTGISRGAGLFFVRGDTIPRHNVPGRPLFAPVAALLFAAGVAALALSWRTRGAIVTLGWLGVMLLPTMLAEDPPHFLRAVGVLPAAVLAAAFGLGSLAALLRRVRPSWEDAMWVVGAILAVGVELGASVGMVRHPAPELGFAYEAGATELAQSVNTEMKSGWRGGWSESAHPAFAWGPVPTKLSIDISEETPAVERAWLDRRLRDGWTSVPFLVPEERVTLVDPYDPILASPGSAYLMPYGLELDEIWREYAAGLTLRLSPGSLERGDLESDARTLYVRLWATPAGEGRGQPADTRPRPVSAVFENGLSLVGATISTPAQPDGVVPGRGNTRSWELTIDTLWEVGRAVDAAPTLFVQVVDGDNIVAAADVPLGQLVSPSNAVPEALFPARVWRTGHRFVERRFLEVPGGLWVGRQVIAGLYEWPGPRPIKGRSPGGDPADSVVLWPRDPQP